jgi:hypothetical protein
VVPHKPHWLVSMTRLPVIWVQQGSELHVIFKEAIKVAMHSVKSEFSQDELNVEKNQRPVACEDVNRDLGEESNNSTSLTCGTHATLKPSSLPLSFLDDLCGVPRRPWARAS